MITPNELKKLEQRIVETDYKENARMNKRKGVFAVIGCLLISVSVGEFNFLPSIYTYIAAYFHYIDPSITKDDMKYISMLWLIGESIGSVLSIWVYTKVGYKLTFTSCLVLFVVSQVVSVYITDYYIWVVVYALLGGIAQGACVVLPLYCGWRYFEPKYKALISGIKLSAFALAPIPMSFFAIYIINPNNIEEPKPEEGVPAYYPKSVADNVPTFILIFSVGFFFIGMLGVLMITEPLSTTPEEDIEKEKQYILKKLAKRNKKQINEFKRNRNKTMFKDRNTQDFGDDYMVALGSIDSSFNDVSLAINDTLNASDAFKDKDNSLTLIKTNISNIQCSNFKILTDKLFLLTWLTMLIGYFIPHVALFTYKPLGSSFGIKPNFLD